MISTEERYRKRRIEIDELEMAYVDEGEGDPIVFLHGNPTSSYVWRNVIPHLTGNGRCIAPDLIGMGDSAKLPDSGPGSYRFVEHRRYLDAFLRALGVRERVVLVLQDWGSALGFDWACRHPAAVRGIAYMEAFVTPIPSWSDWPEAAVAFFQAIRSDVGEEMVIDRNIFVDDVLPSEVLRGLSEEAMAVYRRPYTEPGESRRPTLTWPREVPVAGEPRDVHDIITRYAEWLADSPVPKLFVEAVPGTMFETHRAIARSWPNQAHVTMKGGHMVQEDAPDEIGNAIASWLRDLSS
ncbi:haloalkane dehalogenase [Streptosporangium roseum]|uniref:Alpha/beta hydrolase fold protein n=1 Tax=Streptosporangium roseum (strain ATCC 12428 / DSM 43021 / JCM 3005 / KCTC 9067 / NCIMB 10171 / NRRL 2505 / NI 9100) TaxID=479432 RepID=D2BE60_STRRD|nr:haloalkane dehalogenase [Streptosporangium roseum]ACZ90106.1 alpha/beta hydrolase fold protein [Streptosporangium roseum DSM 43021]